MNSCPLAALAAGFAFSSVTLSAVAAARARPAEPLVTLRYHWAAGQTLTYLVQRDPYFADPARALEAADPNATYQAPVVSLLTEEVLGVGRDGTATLRMTLAPAPGFEDETRPQPARVRTLTVTARGEVLGGQGTGTDAAGLDLLRAFFRLPAGPVRAGATWTGTAGRGAQAVQAGMTLLPMRGGARGLAVITQTLPLAASVSRSPDHDGTLLQTTRTAQSGRIVFDLGRGQLVRETLTLTATLSLTMTGRGKRGVADFGHVVPNVQTVQTWTLERRDAAP